VRRAEQIAGGGERGQLLVAHLRRTAAKATVGRLEVGGEVQFGHVVNSSDRTCALSAGRVGVKTPEKR
jgi:hypothetical protein